MLRRICLAITAGSSYSHPTLNRAVTQTGGFIPIKSQTVLLLAAGLLLGCFSATTLAADLAIRIENLSAAKGKVLLAIYNSSSGFMKPDQAISVLAADAASQPCLAIFKNLPAGQYAVSVFHDENENGKLDTNLFGMPTEAYGFSRDAVGDMGAPSFEQAAITLKSDMEITIHLR